MVSAACPLEEILLKHNRVKKALEGQFGLITEETLVCMDHLKKSNDTESGVDLLRRL